MSFFLNVECLGY